MANDAHGMKSGGSKRGDWIALLIIVIVSLSFHFSYYRYGIQNLVDLGVATVDSERILDGQVPGRDFFDSYGPARFYIIALAFAVAGKSLLTLSGLCVILLAIKDALVFVAARHLVSRRWALFVTALSIMVHGPMHKVFLSLAILLIVLTAFRLIKNPCWKTGALFGLGAFAAGTLRYDMGAAGILMGLMLIVLIPAAVNTARRVALPVAGGIASGLALPGACLVSAYWMAGVDFYVLIENHVKRVYCLEHANLDKPGILDLFSSKEPAEFLLGYTLLFFTLVAFFALIAGIRHWFSAGRRDRKIALMLGVLVVISVLSFNHIRLGIKFLRIGQVGPPVFIALAFLLMYSGMKLKGKGVVPTAIPPAIALSVFAFLGVYIWNYEGAYSQDSFAVLRIEPHYLDHPRGGCAFKGKRGQEVEAVMEFIEQRTEPGEAIFTTASCPLFHFLTDRPNPTPFTDFAFYYFDEKNQEIVIDALNEANVNYIIDWPRPLTGFWFRSSAPIVYAYMKTYFKVERQIGRFIIMKRRAQSDE